MKMVVLVGTRWQTNWHSVCLLIIIAVTTIRASIKAANWIAIDQEAKSSRCTISVIAAIFANETTSLRRR